MKLYDIIKNEIRRLTKDRTAATIIPQGVTRKGLRLYYL